MCMPFIIYFAFYFVCYYLVFNKLDGGFFLLSKFINNLNHAI